MNPLVDVAIAAKAGARYPSHPPYHPSEAYPEYPYKQYVSRETNDAYALVRESLRRLGLDADRFGRSDWNPLGEVIRPGMRVVIKPNMVLHAHPRGGDIDCLITHGSVIRAVLDYVAIALAGSGRVVIGDSPLQGTRFEGVASASGLDRVIEWYREQGATDVVLSDFRQVHAIIDERNHVIGWREVPGDPAGSVTFDLAAQSALAPLGADCRKFRVSNYAAIDTQQYHNLQSHKYVIAKSVIDADLIISMPKMKTHCKVGVTLSMKNLVGTVCRKQCLAHHRHGGVAEGGDEYPGKSRLKAISVALEGLIDGNRIAPVREGFKLAYRANERLIKMLGINPLRDGGWSGNDTAWRMVVDLVRIALYGKADGTLAHGPQRKILSVVDGIIGGENEGPLEATPVPSGCVIAGWNPVTTDMATTTIMGFNVKALALFNERQHVEQWPLPRAADDAGTGELRCNLNGQVLSLAEVVQHGVCRSFSPAEGWAGCIESEGRPGT